MATQQVKENVLIVFAFTEQKIGCQHLADLDSFADRSHHLAAAENGGYAVVHADELGVVAPVFVGRDGEAADAIPTVGGGE